MDQLPTELTLKSSNNNLTRFGQARPALVTKVDLEKPVSKPKSTYLKLLDADISLNLKKMKRGDSEASNSQSDLYYMTESRVSREGSSNNST